MEIRRNISWSAIVAGAIVASALFIVLITFGVAVGIAVGSPAPTWRDSSFAFWIVSGLYLILVAIVSFGAGGYTAGRLHQHAPDPDLEENELRSGLHGLTVWALAVVIGALLAAGGASTVMPAVGTQGTTQSRSVGAENLLAYELDRLFRADRRAAGGDLDYERSEAGRILLTTNGRAGMLQDDRAYLARLVAARTGLSATDAQTRVNAVVVSSGDALQRARRTGVLMGFMTAAALLLGAAVSWFATQRGERDAYGDEISPADSMFRPGGLGGWFAPARKRVVVAKKIDRTEI